MKISYLITCCNETDTLRRLLERVFHSVDYDEIHDDEILLLIDSRHPMGDDVPKDTGDILWEYSGYERIHWIVHPLNNDYGAHKNFGLEHCSGDFIFQLDGDELPPETLIGENLHTLIESNSDTELFWVPRINDFKGVTEEHAKQWGWHLSISPTLNRPIVNWNNGDYQSRIFKNDYPRIKWKKKLHEQIDGYSKYVILPKEEEYAIYHDKTIEKQIQTNLRYNKEFTDAENRGEG